MEKIENAEGTVTPEVGGAPETAAENKLVIAQKAKKRSYKAGEEISYEGLSVTLDGEDVTAECAFSVEEGQTWRKDDKKLTVEVTHEGAEPVSFDLKRKKKMLVPLLCLLLVAAIAGGVTAAWWFYNQPVQGDTGSYLMPKGDMTDEEAQALVDEMAEKSRITVSIAPNMVLEDDGALRVNFVVIEPNNGYSERLEVEQDDQIVYRSGVVDPGYKLVWGQSDGAHEGPAVATVYAVADGADSGNPISVEVQVVGPDFDVNAASDGSAAQDVVEADDETHDEISDEA